MHNTGFALLLGLGFSENGGEYLFSFNQASTFKVFGIFVYASLENAQQRKAWKRWASVMHNAKNILTTNNYSDCKKKYNNHEKNYSIRRKNYSICKKNYAVRKRKYSIRKRNYAIREKNYVVRKKNDSILI